MAMLCQVFRQCAKSASKWIENNPNKKHTQNKNKKDLRLVFQADIFVAVTSINVPRDPNGPPTPSRGNNNKLVPTGTLSVKLPLSSQ